MAGPGNPTQAIVAVACLLMAATASAQQTRTFFVRPPQEYLSRDGDSLPQAESDSEADEPGNPFEDHIETDRDAFTQAVSTTTFRRMIVESSYSFIDNRAAADTNSVPELLIRYGAFRRLELRLGWNYEAGGGGNVVSGSGDESGEGVDTSQLSRETRMIYGFKALVSEQQRWRPSSIFTVTGVTPTSGEATATQLRATYGFGWELPKRLRLDSSMTFSTDSDGGDRFKVWWPSTVLRIPIGERFQVHAEYFGQFSAGRETNFSRGFFSPGMHYLITPNLELGLRVGWGLTSQTANFFSNVGFGWRF